MLLQTKAGLRFCFERCNSCLLFSGQTALYMSSMEGHLEVCKLLIACQADVNVKDTGYTALIESSSSGHLEVCKLLIECQADVNQHDRFQTPRAFISSLSTLRYRNGKTALECATQFPHIQEFLRSVGAKE